MQLAQFSTQCVPAVAQGAAQRETERSAFAASKHRHSWWIATRAWKTLCIRMHLQVSDALCAGTSSACANAFRGRGKPLAKIAAAPSYLLSTAGSGTGRGAPGALCVVARDLQRHVSVTTLFAFFQCVASWREWRRQARLLRREHAEVGKVLESHQQLMGWLNPVLASRLREKAVTQSEAAPAEVSGVNAAATTTESEPATTAGGAQLRDLAQARARLAEAHAASAAAQAGLCCAGLQWQRLCRTSRQGSKDGCASGLFHCVITCSQLHVFMGSGRGGHFARGRRPRRAHVCGNF